MQELPYFDRLRLEGATLMDYLTRNSVGGKQSRAQAIAKLRKLAVLTSSSETCALAIQALQEQDSLPLWLGLFLMVGCMIGFALGVSL